MRIEAYRTKEVETGICRVGVVANHSCVPSVWQLIVCSEGMVHKTFHRGRVLHVLCLKYELAGVLDFVQFLQRMLPWPQGSLISFFVCLYYREGNHFPFIRLNLLEVTAQVVLVQPLHDDDNWSVTRVYTVTDGCLETSVDRLSDVIRQGIIRSQRVIDNYGSQKVTGIERSHKLIHVLYVFFGPVWLTCTKTCDLTQGRCSILTTTCRCAPF